MSFDELGDAHWRWVKGLPGPWTAASSDLDRQVQDDPTIVPITDEEYHAVIEKAAARCPCGGAYRVDAPPRCAVCHSTSLILGEIRLFYD